MLKIDSHQHFWKYHPVKDSWITDDMAILKRNYLPADLAPILADHDISGCVAVQASQTEDESEFLLSLANENDFIKGVVGWVDLKADDIEERLAYYAQFKKMKGFRHVLQAEDAEFIRDAKFKRGIAKLSAFNLTYDILIKANQLKYANELVAAFPQQRFVIDHLAKPAIKHKSISEWKRDISNIAIHQNVYCKVSGMITEADPNNWTEADIEPYLDVVFEAFEPEKLMFGSDWPVCLLAAGYGQVLDVAENYVSKLSTREQQLFWAQNAITFYNL